jgi:hypothetical protein
MASAEAAGSSPADHRQHLFDIGPVGRQLVSETRLQIVVAVRQSQAALREIGLIDLGVAGIVIDEASEQRAAIAPERPAHQGRHPGMVGHGPDIGQQRLDRLGVELFDPRDIHKGGIGRLDLALVGRRVEVGSQREVLDQRPEPVLRQLGQHVEGPVAGAVRGDLQRIEEQAVGEAIEVIARCHRSIAAGHIEAPGSEARRFGAVDQAGGLRRRGVAPDHRNQGAQLIQTGMVVVLGEGRTGRDQGQGAGGQKQGLGHGKPHWATDENRRHGRISRFWRPGGANTP